DELIILTGVDCVYENYGAENQSPISAMTTSQAQQLMAQGQFEPGTMLPKIEAAIAYLEKKPDGRVLITSMDRLKDALKEKAGTAITL
ncbi:MAG: carbamate kinase, partial [Acetatifactor sp.]|nr:carbamate kinase [Acetatifactor sp.]